MNFSKNEIIELSQGKKYIVTNLCDYENKMYYYVREITPDEKKVTDNTKIITTVEENGFLFVKTVKGELYNTLYSILTK